MREPCLRNVCDIALLALKPTFRGLKVLGVNGPCTQIKHALAPKYVYIGTTPRPKYILYDASTLTVGPKLGNWSVVSLHTVEL